MSKSSKKSKKDNNTNNTTNIQDVNDSIKVIKKNVDTDTDKIKNYVLKYLYDRVDMKKNTAIIENEKDLNNIKSSEYVVCPRVNGACVWIIFLKYENCYYSVSFPKHSQIKKKDIKLHPILVSVSSEFYNGTILDGVYYTVSSYRSLIVEEVYMYGGCEMTLKSKQDRLDFINDIILKKVHQMEEFQIHSVQYFHPNKEDLLKLYNKIKIDNTIREIIFYPSIYGRKIYSYTINENDIIDDIIKVTTFFLQKTNTVDVYYVLALDTKTKVSNAYIPDLETSKMVKQWFKDEKEQILKVKCKFVIKYEKWQPIELC